MNKLLMIVLGILLINCSCAALWGYTLTIENQTDQEIWVRYSVSYSSDDDDYDDYDSVKGVIRSSDNVITIPSGASKDIEVNDDNVNGISFWAYYGNDSKYYWIDCYGAQTDYYQTITTADFN